jgi:lysophospholipase L1-like esterase
MAAPTISLSTTGTDPKTTTKQTLETEVNGAIETVWNAAVVASLGEAEAEELRLQLEASAIYLSGAEAARDAAITGAFDTWPTTAAGIGNGVAGVTSIVGGSGGTNGTFALAFSGGTQVLAPVGVFTVAGGALVSVVITYPGYYSSGTPTLSFAASSGLTGASATAQMAANTPVNEYFCVPSAVSGEAAIVYRNLAGVATEIVRTPSTAATLANAATGAALGRQNYGVLSATNNLFNKDDPECANDFFVNHTTGALNANASYFASGYIPVVAAQTYYLSQKSYIAWYTASRVFISGTSPTDTNRVQTAPANAAFLRISLNAADGIAAAAVAYVVNGGTAPATVEPYGGKIIADESRLPDGWITPPKTSFMERGKNLFNKATRTLDSIQSTAGVGYSASYDLSDYIAVEEGETYQYRSGAGGARFRACFDSGFGNLAGESSLIETTSYTVPAASGVRWMRLSIAKDRVDDFQVEVGATATGFQQYGYTFTSDVIGQDGTGDASTWADAKASSFGDSLTSQQQWQPAVASALGLIHTAYGSGGRRISGASGMCQDAAVDTIPSDSDLVLVLGGTNDWANDVVLGTAGSTDTAEFYGALNQMCQKLTARLPNAMIVLLTTPYSEMPGRVTATIWTTATTNNAGLTTRDYAEAIRVAGKRWGFPVIDLSDCGWNTGNLTTFMQNDGNYIHPNAAGGERMARVCIGKLKSIEPTV